MELGEILQKYRKDKGFTQIELADACGISQKEFSQIERNQAVPAFRVINIVVRRCGKTLLDIAKDMLSEDCLTENKKKFLINLIETLI